MSATPESTLANPEQRIADLARQLVEYRAERDEAQLQVAKRTTERDEAQRKLDELTAERDEALEHQTATAEVLQVINSSPGDLAPVFDTLLEKALRLCAASFGQLVTFDGTRFEAAAWRAFGPNPDRAAARAAGAGIPVPGTAFHELVRGEQVVHLPDITADEIYRSGNAGRRRMADEFGARTAIWVALRTDEALLGAFVIYRQNVRPFTDKQIALLQNFAAQAVIAMENARLITETKDALERQTATSEVLETISSSPGHLEPVFEAVLANAVRICGGRFGLLALCDGDGFRGVAAAGLSRAVSDALSRLHNPPPGTGLHRLQESLQTIQVADCAAEPAYDAVRAVNPPMAAVRTALHVPMLKEGALLGAIMIYRDWVAAFTEKEVDLIEGFAKQAVIAIENARLITETREALDQQTATAEVLGVINSSPGNLAPVFDAMLEKAMHLCEATFGTLWTWDGQFMHAAAVRGASTAYTAFLLQGPHPPSPIAHQPLLQGVTMVHMEDLRATEGCPASAPMRQIG
jgi:GAF domain-containing protein